MSINNPLNEDPITHEKGAHPVGTGLGASGGAVAGAAIGSMVGPLGTLAGGIVGAIAGGLAGKEVAESANPTVGGDGEDHIVGEGVGASAGVMAGVAMGSIAGPVGSLIGAAVGAFAGGALGEKVDEIVNPDDNTITEETNFPSDPHALGQVTHTSSTDLDNAGVTHLHTLPDATTSAHPVANSVGATLDNPPGSQSTIIIDAHGNRIN